MKVKPTTLDQMGGDVTSDVMPNLAGSWMEGNTGIRDVMTHKENVYKRDINMDWVIVIMIIKRKKLCGGRWKIHISSNENKMFIHFPEMENDQKTID